MSGHFRLAALALLAFIPSFSAPARAQSSPFSQRWSGFSSGVFTPDGARFWVAEDGGRIRHRNAQGVWSHQVVPDSVKDTLRRVFFLDDGLRGWAVGIDSKIVKTTDGGSSPWQLHTSVPAPGLDLWDVRFLEDGLTGWLVSLHRVYFTYDGGQTWTEARFFGVNHGHQYTDSELDTFEFYSVDVMPLSAGGVLGMVSCEPGYVFRTTDGEEWDLVLNIRSKLCLELLLNDCFPATICDSPSEGFQPPRFEPWSVRMGRDESQPIAIVVGGVGTSCGAAFRSSDEGDSWVRELHECHCTAYPGCQPCLADPQYNPAPPPATWRLQAFRTLYDVAIDREDNATAIAGGYQGQHVRRDPSTGVWRDRSSVGDIIHTPAAVTMPLNGASTGGTSGSGMLVGYGGFIRETSNGGATWTTSPGTYGGPWRLRDAWSPGGDVVWVVGQLQRIAWSEDGGHLWHTAEPKPALGTLNLMAITFAPGDQSGVTVGEPETRDSEPDFEQPKILFTRTGGMQDTWAPGTIGTHPEISSTSKTLNEVDWSGTGTNGEVFWATGTGGLILNSRDDGENWDIFFPPGADPTAFQQIDFESVAFRDGSTGIFVGRNTATNLGVAYQYSGSGGPLWSAMDLDDASIRLIADVDVRGDLACAVGVRDDGTGPRGVILKSEFGAGGFARFTTVATVDPCTVGPGLVYVPVLNEVEMVPASDDVWVAGQCGRVWRFTPPSSLVEFKSQTDAHVMGMSFPGASVGYMACQRKDGTQTCFVRFTQ